MQLILSFPDQSKSFVNGVEFGRLFAKMEQGDESISNSAFPVHIENKELIESACKQYGYVPSFGAEYYNTWIDFIAIKPVICNN